MSGWIKLHRKMKEWEWYNNAPAFRLFTHLLLSANYKETTWKGLKIKPGQVITGRKTLSQETGLSEMQVRTALNNLKSTSEITIKSYNKFSIITIVSWVDHQEDNQQNTQNITTEITTSKEVKKKEERKKEDTDLKTNPDAVDYEKFKEFFNETTKGVAPSMRVLSEPRKRAIRFMIKKFGKKTVSDVIKKSADVKFFNTWAGFGFDWIMKESNFIKVMEGTYDNKKQSFSKNGQTEIVYTAPKVKTDWK
jgi:hypothetical protein